MTTKLCDNCDNTFTPHRATAVDPLADIFCEACQIAEAELQYWLNEQTRNGDQVARLSSKEQT